MAVAPHRSLGGTLNPPPRKSKGNQDRGEEKGERREKDERKRKKRGEILCAKIIFSVRPGMFSLMKKVIFFYLVIW